MRTRREAKFPVGFIQGVARSLIGERWMVSTVYLDLANMYETMVFSANKMGEITDFAELYRRRYRTRAEAETGHEEIVACLVTPGVTPDTIDDILVIE